MELENNATEENYYNDEEEEDEEHDNNYRSKMKDNNKTATNKQLDDDQNWQQEKTRVKVKQFMNILEQLPRLCSPTICGTLSQPTTRSERLSRGTEVFEWSLEQKAILSPANITTDLDGTGDWQNLADLNPSWLQQESENFFSQRTIAPSPMITTTPSARSFLRTSSGRQQINTLKLKNPIYNEEDEEDEFETNNNINEFEENYQDPQDLSMNNKFETSDDDDEDQEIKNSNSYQMKNEDEEDRVEEDQHMDDLCFSPEPLKSSQTQQKMDIFSPETFSRVMEDENTLQSTPKTIGSFSQRVRNRNPADMYD